MDGGCGVRERHGGRSVEVGGSRGEVRGLISLLWGFSLVTRGRNTHGCFGGLCGVLRGALVYRLVLLCVHRCFSRAFWSGQ